MSSEIKMNYPVVEDMLYAIGDALDVLRESQAEVIRMADTLQEGAMISRGGIALEHVFRQTLNNKLQRMIDEYVELCHDVSGAMEEMLALERGGQAR